MRLLAAVLAGGRSRRFGSDKAEARIGQRRLLDVVTDALAPQADRVIVVGRASDRYASVPDCPAPDLGPLGGLCAALRYGQENAFDWVLTAGCDVLPVPDRLIEVLTPGPSVIVGQPLFGLWPASLFDTLAPRLAGAMDRSMRGWVAETRARGVALDMELHNLNTPDDLARYRTKEDAVDDG